MGIKIPRDPTVEKLKLQSKAEKTQKSYDGDWLKFVTYSKKRFNANPLEVDTIEDAYNLTEGYLNWLHTNQEAIELKGKSEKNNADAPSSNADKKSYKSSTIKRILASITYKYRINNFNFDRKNPQISETMAAISRNRDIKSGQKKELLKEDIIKIVNPLFNSDNITDIRDKAMILVGFYSFCRRSEILAIKYEDLIFSDDGSIQVRINFSKTDQTGIGRVIDLPKKDGKYCPVKSLTEWLDVVLIKQGPLFYKINKTKSIESHKLNEKKGFLPRSLTAGGFVKILKQRATNVGIDSVNIGAHSLRIGAITQARMDNVPTHEIMKQSGHATTQMIDRYTKITDIKKNSAARKI